MPTHVKHTDAKASAKQPPRNPGRDYHSAKEKQVHSAKESARTHGKNTKHD